MFSIKRTPVKKSPAKKMSVKSVGPKKTFTTLEKALIAYILGNGVATILLNRNKAKNI